MKVSAEVLFGWQVKEEKEPQKSTATRKENTTERKVSRSTDQVSVMFFVVLRTIFSVIVYIVCAGKNVTLFFFRQRCAL